MTMHIVFKHDKDGYKEGWAGYVERTLARRFCDNGIAVTYQEFLDEVYEAEQANKKKPAQVEKKEDKKTELENKKPVKLTQKKK